MKEIISSILDLKQNEYQAFKSISKFKKASKNSLLIQSGKITNKIIFLESGAVRAYRLVEGNDYTHFFFMDKWFVTDYKNYLTGQQGKLNIEALTDIEYYEFYKKDIEKINDSFPKFEKLWKVVAEKAFLFTVNRLENLQTKNLTQRYNNLLEQNPKLILSFPQKHIASYLGVSEQSLSRIKKVKLIS